MDMSHMIDVSKADVREIVRAAYDLSIPLGLGIIHYTPGPLTDDEVDEVLSHGNSSIIASLDYIKGRSVKLTIWRQDDKIWINNQWFDHSDRHLRRLLDRIGVDPEPALSKARTK